MCEHITHLPDFDWLGLGVQIGPVCAGFPLNPVLLFVPMDASTLQIICTLIAAIPPSAIALLAWLSSRKNKAAINEIHVSINSRMDQLLEASKGQSRAEGVVAGAAGKE